MTLPRAVTREEALGILHAVRENHARLRSCSARRLGEPHQGPGAMHRVDCELCKGSLTVAEARYYAAGYVAAGGALAAVWPYAAAEAPQLAGRPAGGGPAAPG